MSMHMYMYLLAVLNLLCWLATPCHNPIATTIVPVISFLFRWPPHWLCLLVLAPKGRFPRCGCPKFKKMPLPAPCETSNPPVSVVSTPIAPVQPLADRVQSLASLVALKNLGSTARIPQSRASGERIIQKIFAHFGEKSTYISRYSKKSHIYICTVYIYICVL